MQRQFKSSSLKASVSKFIPPRNDSGEKDPDDPHFRFNCASNFESLASHLNETMNTTRPNKSAAIWWIRNCIRARENLTAKRLRLRLPTDRGHERVLFMLRRLSKFILENIEPGETAVFGFRNEPQRFLIRTFSGKEATIYSNAVVNRLEGGRKLTRKNRKTNRKTYRILPRVEGS